MSEWTHKDGVDGIKKQAQELIEQAYQRGFKAGQENALAVDSDKFREQGRVEAWDVADKLNRMPLDEVIKVFADDPLCHTITRERIFACCTPSCAIKKMHDYEQKKQEKDEIKVGDEVFLNEITKAVVLRTNMDGSDNYCFIVCSDGSGGKWKKSELKKTGRHFDKIAEVLKKMGGKQDADAAN